MSSTHQRKLHIDIETFSSENLKTSGVYRYAEADDFAIMLFAYGYDNYAPRVVDLTAGEQIPLDVVADLIDENVLKVAHNAQFERVCLRAHYLKKGNAKMAEIVGNPAQWDCTAVKAARLGLPMPLADVASVLKLDAQKDKEGKALIQFFSVPQKTKLLSDPEMYLKNFPATWIEYKDEEYIAEQGLDSAESMLAAPKLYNAEWRKFFKICKWLNEQNPLTHVNDPKDYPEKWEAYKKYNRQDVIVEQAIDMKLDFYPVTESERQLYILDQKINDRGVLIDLPFVHSVLKIDQVYTDKLWNEAIELTGLDNPNSAAQLKKWLIDQHALEVVKMRKEDVADLIKTTDNADAQRMLQIRQELAKTSIKKYDAMLACVCKDGRARGLFQFYGAGRTGRWAGRLIQMQNLPKSDHKKALQALRDLAAEGNADEIDMLFGNVPSQLSQLIRTAFISAPGKDFNVSDFSAIEARVLAWLAGEEWRLDVFRGDGKIYEASAAQMFKVPVESIGKGNPLRQKGKIAELALGYGGGVGALETMGALKMGLEKKELQPLITAWRSANPGIVSFWKTVEKAAIAAVHTGVMQTVEPGLKFFTEKGVLFIELPSGRRLSYMSPSLSSVTVVQVKFLKAVGKNQEGDKAYLEFTDALKGKDLGVLSIIGDPFERRSLSYEAMIQETHKWGKEKTYGGKLVENITQAFARDCLAWSMLELDKLGYYIVGHVHDEIIDESADKDIHVMEQLMSTEIPWAPGLPLGAEGFVSPFYRK